jgi:hypothetical protein
MNDCQLQGGYGTGNVGGAVANNVEELFVEKNDVYGYTPVFYSGFNIALTDFFKTYFTGVTRVVAGTTYGHYIITVDNHTGDPNHQFGDAWLPNYAFARQVAATEAWQATHGYCPVVNNFQFFGEGQNYLNLNRPGFDGGSMTWRRWSHDRKQALREEVPAGAA